MRWAPLSRPASSAGWNTRWIVPEKWRVLASWRAAPSSMVVWPSCPQACMAPALRLAWAAPLASRIGSASMSARRLTRRVPAPAVSVPTTPWPPTLRVTW